MNRKSRLLSMMYHGACFVLTLAATALLPANSSDVLEYLGFGRLLGLYGLNPYTHTYSEITDAFSPYITWDNPMPYGPPLIGTEDDGADRGLLGLFLCANILRQILTLTMWARQNDFADVYSGSMRVQDALIGNRAPSADSSFTVPGAGVIERLPSFVTTKGTALALYPSATTMEALTVT